MQNFSIDLKIKFISKWGMGNESIKNYACLLFLKKDVQCIN